jgi:cell division protein FtsB
MGKLLWIQPKGKGKITSQDIQIAQLKRKIEKLESAIAIND